MMFAMPAGLGMIPDWQFSSDPRINIKINPHLPIPAPWAAGQRTIQPVGYVSNRVQGDPLAGLGITQARWAEPRVGLGALEIFDSWAWKNRKPIAIAGVALLGLAALSGVGVLLR